MSTTCCERDTVIDDQPEARQTLDTYLDSLPLTDDSTRNRGFLIQSLHKAQDLFGYLPESVQLLVANKLGIHLSQVYGVISFYSFFSDTPSGEFRINVCTGTACFVKGAGKIVEEFTRLLGIDEGETTGDMRFSLGGLRCVGACSLAPVVMVNERVYGNVTPEMVPEILNDCE
ncbi:MAG: NAD(P)H-dependent oxidoreductase subunit E [Verrucomicrobia bacterium]|jgi:NADH-quinone oxidoreductase subunit E|nr:NAD(P)H-dependent oxidoreductase subunit E [Verrucomicrobiota bacterium]MBT7701402.1 NAD(P)H-dependent oxidoreductase subunit E [Verrucomicrobiota bacterium]